MSITFQDKKTGKIAKTKLVKIGNKDINTIKNVNTIMSKNNIRWDNIDTDLDIAIVAEYTKVEFNWIVKSENAPHEMEFEIQDGGIPVKYTGLDADHKPIEVTIEQKGNRVIERIEKGGKYPKTINPTINVQTGEYYNDTLV
ncbi:MAG: hypothetical protein JXA46_11405 [Dehalococcoidales bacterium]|nr:hypothetical protein [Dehalococcoidales bacterium]